MEGLVWEGQGGLNNVYNSHSNHIVTNKVSRTTCRNKVQNEKWLSYTL